MYIHYKKIENVNILKLPIHLYYIQRKDSIMSGNRSFIRVYIRCTNPNKNDTIPANEFVDFVWVDTIIRCSGQKSGHYKSVNQYPLGKKFSESGKMIHIYLLIEENEYGWIFTTSPDRYGTNAYCRLGHLKRGGWCSETGTWENGDDCWTPIRNNEIAWLEYAGKCEMTVD